MAAAIAIASLGGSSLILPPPHPSIPRSLQTRAALLLPLEKSFLS
ncbi:MAG: hypothetical protein ACP5ID_05480 [Conexivisphaera sp.]